MKKPKWDNPEDLERKINEYFDRCEKSKTEYVLKNGDVRVKQEHPSVIGLSVFLDCDKDTINSYLRGDEKKSMSAELTESITAALARAKRRIEAETLNNALNGDCDPKIAALCLAAYGYGKEQSDATVTVRVEGAGAPDVEGWSK